MKKFIAVTTRVNEEKLNYNPYNYYQRMTERDWGVIPLVNQNDEFFEYLLDQCSGLVITGGEDVDPQWYGQKRLEQCGKQRVEDDKVDMQAFKYAMAHHMPVLGICRGIQVINVALGGTLYQDLATQRPGSEEHSQFSTLYDKTQKVNLTLDGWIANVLNKTEIMVNSTHHQAICQPGPGVRVVATCQDGVVEGISYGDNILGVQWHPERMTDQSDSRFIFDYYLALCRKYNAGK